MTFPYDPRSLVLTYSRPLGAMTLPPAPVWSVSLACYVRAQPVEFIEIPTSAGFHQGVFDTLYRSSPSSATPPISSDVLDDIDLPTDLETE